MIEINDLEGLALPEIDNLIEDENRNILEIYVPKSTQRYFSEASAIATDYAYAAYSGQKLSDISTSFTYEEVPPENHESILFEVSATDRSKLAEVLWHLSCLYGFNEDLEIEEGQVQECVEQFLYELNLGNLKAACPYFIDVRNEFAEEDKEDDEDG